MSGVAWHVRAVPCAGASAARRARGASPWSRAPGTNNRAIILNDRRPLKSRLRRAVLLNVTATSVNEELVKGNKNVINKKFKVADLRDELVRRGEASDGKKGDLIDRLLALGPTQESSAVDTPVANDEPDIAAPSQDNDGDASPPRDEAPREMKHRDGRRQRSVMSSRPAERVSGGDGIDEDGESNFSGMEVTFLGTSSGSPSFTRNVSSYALRLTDEIWLFDCGEATQHQLMRSHLKYSKITRIFITHMHGDHIFGLPGLICALSGASAEKRRVHGKDPDPLYITGPPGICEFVKSAIACSRTVLGLPLVVTELTAPGNGAAGAGADAGAADPRAVAAQTHFAADARQKMFLGERWPDNGAATAPHFKDVERWESAWDGSLTLPFWTVHREKPKNAGGERGGASGGLVVRAAPLRHPVACFGYVVDEPDQAGRIDAERCVALGLPPGKEYARLKSGFDVQTKEGRTITPAMVLGCDRPGRRLCLLGDTCDSVGIARLARGADVLVHESTFAAYKHKEAVYKGHSTSVMAGEFARTIKARNLLLTHFSNRYGTTNTRQNGTDGSESSNPRKRRPNPEDDEIEDDMALPEGAPEDMRAAAQEEFTLVEGLVREAARAKGDARVVAASDFFVFNVQRRERFDEVDDAKGDRDALFAGPLVAPTLETHEDARRRMESGGKGYYSQNYAGGGGAAAGANQRGFRGRGRGRADSGYAAYSARGRGGRGIGRGRGRLETRERLARAEDGSFQRRRAYEDVGAHQSSRQSRGVSRSRPSDPLERRAAAFDADTASVDSASLVRDFHSRREE